MKLALALIIAATIPDAVSAAEPPPVRDFVVFPASTPLHKILFGDEDVFVAVNGKAKLDADALKKELKPLAGAGKHVGFQVVVEHSTDDEEETARQLHEELARLAKEVGFAKKLHQSTSYVGRFDWAADTAPARKAIADGRTGDETGRGDGGVRVYPVRTPLSVYLTKDAQVVADVSPEAMRDLIGLERRIAALLEKQQIEPEGRIRIITRHRASDPRPDDGFERRLQDLAKRLGYDENNIVSQYE